MTKRSKGRVNPATVVVSQRPAKKPKSFAGVAFLKVDDQHYPLRGNFTVSPSLVADPVNHPPHYGGADNVYEAIKVIEAWGLGFNLGNALKYIARADHKGQRLEDLKKGLWYLAREISRLERQK